MRVRITKVNLGSSVGDSSKVKKLSSNIIPIQGAQKLSKKTILSRFFDMCTIGWKNMHFYLKLKLQTHFCNDSKELPLIF